jgi:hypothetical protein
MVLKDFAHIPSKRNWIPCIHPDDVIFCPNNQLSKHYPSERQELSVRAFLCVEKLRTVPSCISPDISTVRLDAVQCKISYGISFQKHRYGKIATIVWTMCIPVRTCSFIRHVMHSKFNRPDDSLHGPGA